MNIDTPPPSPDRNSSAYKSTHNKSGKKTLSILDFTDDELKTLWDGVQYTVEEGPIEDHPCWIMSAADGRVSVNSKKPFHAYQLAAFIRYGRDNFAKIPSVKQKTSLVISHVCGNGPRCCNPFHLILERKSINDERAHCHFSFRNAFEKGGYQEVYRAYTCGICNHNPPCLYITWL